MHPHHQTQPVHETYNSLVSMVVLSTYHQFQDCWGMFGVCLIHLLKPRVTEKDHHRQGVDDVLDGAGGHNIVMGGLLSDTFVFRAADNGSHVVVDVEPWDTLRMEGFGYDAAVDVARYLNADGTDVVFSDEGVTIRFLETDVAAVLDMEFEF